MREKLGKFGEIDLSLPESMGIWIDFTTTFGRILQRQAGGDVEADAQLARLCAAAIGACYPLGAGMPSYKGASPLKYGLSCLDRLLEHGVSTVRIYGLGAQIIGQMLEGIPTDQEVEEKTAFFAGGEG